MTGGALPVQGKSHKAGRQERYLLQEQIGAGGMGTVYRAWDRELSRVIAVKVLRPELSSSLNSLLRLKRELVLASRVSDGHVVHDIGEIAGKPLIAMDWVDGENLASLLRRVHRLPPAQTCDFAAQICQALCAIHAARIVHRDLKPANLLITRTGEILVSDFGLARSDFPTDPRLSETGQRCGTPLYMAPEQLAGLPADARSDLYSFGMVLLEMLTGTAALEALDGLRDQWLAADTEKHVRAGELRKLAILDRVIRGCVRLDRNERYASADRVLADLCGGAEAVAVPARVEPSSPHRRMHGRAILMAGAAVFAALVFLLTFRGGPHTVAPVNSAEQSYAAAMGLMASGSGEPELRAAEQAIHAALGKRPRYLPAVQAQIEIRIRLFEATADPGWLTKARQALQSPAAAGLSSQLRTLFQARIDLLSRSFSEVIRNLQQDGPLLAGSADANRLLGRALEGSGQLAAALPFYRTAVRLSPESWLAHNELGSALLAMGSLQEAAHEFLRVTRLQPRSPAGFSNLGLASLYAGDLAGARRSFESALALQPAPETYFNLGLTTYFSRQYASSIPFFEAALRIRPNSHHYLAALADALRQLGKTDEARQAYSRTLSLLDQSAAREPPTLEQRCSRALCFARLGDSASARTVVETAEREQPDDSDVLYTAAVLAATEGRTSAARDLIAKALRQGYPAGMARADPDLAGIY